MVNIARKVILDRGQATMVWNTTKKSWEMTEELTAEKMTASSGRLQEIDTDAAAAKVAAQEAQEAAESKASVADIRESLFPARDANGMAVIMTSLSFACGDDGWGFEFCFHPPGRPEGGQCAAVAYVTKSQLKAVKDEVEALKKELADMKKAAGIK